MRLLSCVALALCVGLISCGTDSAPVAGAPRAELGLTPSPLRAGDPLTFSLTLSGTPAPWNVALLSKIRTARSSNCCPTACAPAP